MDGALPCIGYSSCCRALRFGLPSARVMGKAYQEGKAVPRKTYDAATQSAFLEAVISARAAGQPWVDAFKAAKEAGYTGTLGGIERMYREMKGKGKMPGRKPGRPKGSVSAKKRGNRLYDEAMKAAIVNAALEARKAGKKWRQALEAAKAVGYCGGLISLIGFVNRPGRVAKKPGRPARKAQVVGGLEPIQEIMERLVKERVGAASRNEQDEPLFEGMGGAEATVCH